MGSLHFHLNCKWISPRLHFHRACRQVCTHLHRHNALLYLIFFCNLYLYRNTNKRLPRRKSPVGQRVESFVFMRPKFNLTCIMTSGNQPLSACHQDLSHRFPWEQCELIPVVKACDYFLLGRLLRWLLNSREEAAGD